MANKTTPMQILKYFDNCELQELNYFKGALELAIIRLDEKQFKAHTTDVNTD